MKKVELLAPAGNYECFLGAIHAGADAVYLGGNKFGARAYADNFSREDIISAIKYAHVYGSKVYLTLNTLVKEEEFGEIYDYLSPLYLAGLDAVIVQDMGVFHAIGRWFPDLELHISTQMSVTGSYGASYLKKLGAKRIVPARELSLAEIKKIKDTVDIEIETFVHGAVCYCYSGQCLFSSILGGRSGNRGRCAQPCRLPYEVELKEGKKRQDGKTYPLSAKDMCSIELVPELIEAGIDSFKIEGRMKSPEYVAGVTSLYRKYIDKYYAEDLEGFQVDKADMDKLRSLYIRSEISEGYYHKHNGRDMITLDNPSYRGQDEAVLQEIRQKYLEGDFRLPIIGKAVLYKNRPARFTVTYKDIEAVSYGNVVDKAQKQPLTEDGVKKQLIKSGNTAFFFEHMDIDMESDIFIPVKALNELRRTACEELEEKIRERNELAYRNRPQGTQDIKAIRDIIAVGDSFEKEDTTSAQPKTENRKAETKLHAFVQNKGQLQAVRGSEVARIYLSSDLFMEEDSIKLLENFKKDVEIYLALPYVIRDYDTLFLNQMERLLQENPFTGVLIRNQEQLQWLQEISWKKGIVSDANLYIWNKEAYDAYMDVCQERYLPYELNFKETARLIDTVGNENLSQIVYGRIPMMITANCITKTMGRCRKGLAGAETAHEDIADFLRDRYRKEFPVYCNCRHCYNIIYNSVPMSLHNGLTKLEGLGISSFRLDFTTETKEETKDILTFYEEFVKGRKKGQLQPPFMEFTNGHFNRGVE